MRGRAFFAEGRQEIAGGFHVGLFDFRDGIGLHGDFRYSATNGKVPRDTISRGEILRLPFLTGGSHKNKRGATAGSDAALVLRSLASSTCPQSCAGGWQVGSSMVMRVSKTRELGPFGEGIVKSFESLTSSIGISGGEFSRNAAGWRFLRAKLSLPTGPSLVTIEKGGPCSLALLTLGPSATRVILTQHVDCLRCQYPRIRACPPRCIGRFT